MKRMFFAVAAAIALVSAAAAQGAPIGEPSFVGTMDLTVGIGQLAGLANSPDGLAAGGITRDSALLLFGTLSKPSIESEEPFWAVAEFLEGEWQGSSQLVLTRVFLHLRSEAFRE